VFALSFVGAQHAASGAPQGAALWCAFMACDHGFTSTSCPQKTKAPIEVPDLVGTDSGRLSLTYKKASSAKPGRTFLRL
jgi:hypothetical protein